MHGGAETAPGAQHCLERRQRLRREQCLLNCCCLSRNGALRPSAHGQSLTKPNWTASRNHDFRLGKHFRATTAQAQVLGFRMPAIPAIVCSCKNREIQVSPVPPIPFRENRCEPSVLPWDHTALPMSRKVNTNGCPVVVVKTCGIRVPDLQPLLRRRSDSVCLVVDGLV